MLEKLKALWGRVKYFLAAIIFSLGLAFIIFKKGFTGESLGHYFRTEKDLREEAERKKQEEQERLERQKQEKLRQEEEERKRKTAQAEKDAAAEKDRLGKKNTEELSDEIDKSLGVKKKKGRRTKTNV